jgi:hypothetical protein
MCAVRKQLKGSGVLTGKAREEGRYSMSSKLKSVLLLSTVLFWATWVSASVVIIQSKGCNATTCTFNSPTTSGNAILVAGATAGNGSNFTPTDNFSNPYVQDDRAGANFGANGTWLTLYRASTITSGTTTISTTSTGAVRTLTILEVAGLDPSPVDVKNQAGNTWSGGSCNSAVITTNANDLVLNFCIDNSSSTNWAAQSPWLEVITTTGGYSSGVESQNTGVVATFTPSWIPSSVGGDYANITIAYKAGSPVKPSTSQPSVSIITEVYGGRWTAPQDAYNRPLRIMPSRAIGSPYTSQRLLGDPLFGYGRAPRS